MSADRRAEAASRDGRVAPGRGVWAVFLTPVRMRMFTRWLLLAELRSHPARLALAIVTIALGVALGYAVQLINGAAFNEFSAAARSLSGQADLQVRGAQPDIDETWYPRLTQVPGVALASPVLELSVTVPGQTSALTVLGIDVFRATRMTPELVGMPASDRPLDTLADDAIFLSPAAQQWLHVAPGGFIGLQSGTSIVRLRVAGGLVSARPGQRLAVMDIAAAQWRFDRVGRISRVDLQLTRGVNREAFKRALQAQVGKLLLVSETQDDEHRTDRLSRAYRVNMNVLALVALFTGAFLVFSTQALSVVRRRASFAMLRVIGLTRGELLRQILLEGTVLGVLGAIAGLVLGYALASVALRFFGSDLGGGYFPGVRPRVAVDVVATIVFGLLGVAVSVAGSLVPALEAARARPAAALKAGSEEGALARLSTPWPALTLLAIAAALTQLPPLFDMPIAGYAAVALLLIGGIALMPRCAAWVFSAMGRAYDAAVRHGVRRAVPHARHACAASPIVTLALARLANAPGQASIAMSGVLSSFSLIVAMVIMVASFRVSVDTWLTHLLVADVYVRVSANGDTGGLRTDQQAQLRAVPGVAHAAFMRTSKLSLDPGRPAVTLIARELDAADPGATLQMTGPVLPAASIRGDETPIWISEAMVDLYGLRLGQGLTLPIGGADRAVVVAGVWRDYARQTGAIQLRLADYQRLTGDTTATDAGITLQAAAHAARQAHGSEAAGDTASEADTVIAAMRRLPFGDALTFEQRSDIRTRTMTIFDRSFAITYLLEAVAIVIGLFGVAATFSAQTLARVREFGMLRHVGVRRVQLVATLATEAALLTGLGIALGFILGMAISLILVFVVNPQSFHWTMSLHIPWRVLLAVAAVLLVSSSVTSVVSGRKAISIDAVRAVREDW